MFDSRSTWETNSLSGVHNITVLEAIHFLVQAIITSLLPIPTTSNNIALVV